VEGAVERVGDGELELARVDATGGVAKESDQLRAAENCRSPSHAYVGRDRDRIRARPIDTRGIAADGKHRTTRPNQDR